MAVLGRAPAVGGVDEPDEAEVTQAIEGPFHRGAVVGDHGVTVRALIARCDECIQREWVVLRGGELLLDQAPQHPGFDGIEFDLSHICHVATLRRRSAGT